MQHIAESILQRKGATKTANIPAEVIDLLNRGEIESANLTEWLALDQIKLLKCVLVESDLNIKAEDLLHDLHALKEKKIMEMINLITQGLLVYCKGQSKEHSAQLFKFLASHPSDSVRCWAAYLIGISDYTIQDKLLKIRRFAADQHFGVREIAWIAVRKSIIDALKDTLDILEEWAGDQDDNIRRFSVESIRPRGVWSKHITQLKNNPELAIKILNNLKSDPSKYVQDSVGNWLNDASKSNPDWVSDLCEEWQRTSDSKHTKRIVLKAMRTIAKI